MNSTICMQIVICIKYNLLDTQLRYPQKQRKRSVVSDYESVDIVSVNPERIKKGM